MSFPSIKPLIEYENIVTDINGNIKHKFVLKNGIEFKLIKDYKVYYHNYILLFLYNLFV
jgi:hypothetical protein